MKAIMIKSKTHGEYIFIVDDADYVRLKKLKSLKWCVSKKRKGLIYFQKRFSDGKIRELHRWIIQPPKGKYVDHIDGNTLDNRRSNLRVCSNAANLRNGTLRLNNKSGYTGVFFHKDTGRWSAYIKVVYKRKHLGMFDTIKEAVKTRKSAEKKYFNI